ncbi:uncharacterized protein (TIGR02594 family) [Roseiarcus fermentans]|uniref:Uncharacterized protein (TIGR02594 family) n=2 Tax=Roseiarcus fermentans TaxID=1473586 RepID=A0A366FBH4_9HYPH|nr:uncharacterized protein (TIGR02594 family) [Roseiarcus fermentans]
MKTVMTIPAVLTALTISGAAEASGRYQPPSIASAALASASANDAAGGASALRAEASQSRGDVVAEAERWLGSRNMTGKGGPWCAHFASYVLQRTGHRPLANGMASSALGYGRRLVEPKVGALAVVTTRDGFAAHVGFVSGLRSDGSIELISGNWGRRVTDSAVSRRSVVAFVDVM